MKKHINIVILVLLVLNAVLIYFTFFGFKERSKELKISNDESIVKKITVDYEAFGNPFSDIRITDISESDSQINAVATTLGTSFDISGNFSNFQLQEATVVLEYDKDKLPEGTTEDDLGILWYDEENNKMVEIECEVDKKDGTISFTTEHFSKYVFIDITKWHEVWAKQMAKVRDTKAKFSVSFIIDDSGSMSSNDSQKKRIDATKQAIESLSGEDRYSIIKFSDNSSVLQDFTSDKDDAEDDYEEFHSSGGTNIVGAVERGIEILEEEDKDRDKLIILLTDGEDSNLASKKDELVRKADDLGIVIFGIGLEANENSNLNFDVFSSLATETSGKFYRINDTGLTDIFTEVTNSTVGIDGTVDTDEDGIPDGLEIAGMRDQFGNIITTDPTRADTDGDNKSDLEEMGELIYGENGTLYYKRVSDPRVDESKAAVRSVDYALGPGVDSVKENVWDSGFRANVNALSFRNFAIDDAAGGGICEGFATFTERVFNGNFERSRTLPTLSIKGTNPFESRYVILDFFAVSPGYDLKGVQYNNMFNTKKLYSYVPASTKLYDLRTRTLNADKIVNKDLKESEPDGALIRSLYFYWIEGNRAKTKIMDFSFHMVTDNTLNKLKSKFANEKKIVTIDLPSHAINGYALKKVSENYYFLYVYDNNYPYDPYSLTKPGEAMIQRNNIILLERVEKKRITGGTKVYYNAYYNKVLYLKDSDKVNEYLSEEDTLFDDSVVDYDKIKSENRRVATNTLPIYINYEYLN